MNYEIAHVELQKTGKNNLLVDVGDLGLLSQLYSPLCYREESVFKKE